MHFFCSFGPYNGQTHLIQHNTIQCNTAEGMWYASPFDPDPNLPLPPSSPPRSLSPLPTIDCVDRMSWSIFITWTSTIFGLLWALYLLVISRQAQHSTRPYPVGHSTAVDLGANGASPELGAGSGGGADAFKSKICPDGRIGGVLKVGAVVPPSPWRESVRSLVLFAAVLAFLPSWKALSDASTLATLLGPVALALVAMFVGLTVQMVRLPVLWCDRCKFLALVERDGLYA